MTANNTTEEEKQFTDQELKKIEEIKSRYPETQAAVMPVLWLAQEKFGHLDESVQQLVARTLELPEAHVHGVVTFYHQYFDHPKGKYVLDVCTSFTCQVCGGPETVSYLEEKLGIKAGETTEDGMFTIEPVECLGACGYAPVMLVANDKYVNHLTREKIDRVIDDLRNGKELEFESQGMPLLTNRGKK